MINIYLVKSRVRLVWAAVLTAVLMIIFTTGGCVSLQTLFQNPRYIYEDGAVLVDGADLPIELKNNSQAINVTFVSLIDFLRQDDTDQNTYIERGNPDGLTPFVCSDFAERLHNNAEEAGIRAGYVSIDWINGEIGHAINAFETTDEGLIFIDCTGESQYSQMEENGKNVSPGSWDKVAYVVSGRQYGVINIAYAESGDYSFYERFEEKWQTLKEKLAAYNAEVKLYNQEIQSKLFIEDTPEIARIRAWEKTLTVREDEINRLSSEVGFSRFRPLGIVKNYEIHW